MMCKTRLIHDEISAIFQLTIRNQRYPLSHVPLQPDSPLDSVCRMQQSLMGGIHNRHHTYATHTHSSSLCPSLLHCPPPSSLPHTHTDRHTHTNAHAVFGHFIKSDERQAQQGGPSSLPPLLPPLPPPPDYLKSVPLAVTLLRCGDGREQSSTHACRRRGARTFFRHCHLKTSGFVSTVTRARHILAIEYDTPSCQPTQEFDDEELLLALPPPFCLQHLCICTDHQLDHGHVFAWLYDASKTSLQQSSGTSPSRSQSEE